MAGRAQEKLVTTAMSEQPAGQKTEGGAAASGAGGFSTAVIIEFVCCFLGLQVSYLG